MNKNKKFPVWLIVLGVFWLISSDWGIFFFLPTAMFLPIIILVAVVLYFTRNARNTTKTTRNNNVKQENLVRAKVEEYLRSHDVIYINQDITLKLVNEERDVLKRLGVFFDDSYVSRLSEFSAYDALTYEKLLESLAQLDATKPQEQPEEKTPGAEYFIEEINKYNVEIKHEEISNYLYLTSSLLTNLMDAERKGIAQDKRIRKLYMYYLPILMEILGNYCNMKDNQYVSTDLKAMEEKLIKTIILCNEALKTVLTSMNESDVINMNVNMSTLETILKKDGMVKDMEMERVKEAVK